MSSKDMCQLGIFSQQSGFVINSSSGRGADVLLFEDGIFVNNSSWLDIAVNDQSLNDSNATLLNAPEVRNSTYGSFIFAVGLVCLVVVGAVANSLIIVSVRKPHIRNPIHMTVVNLALADLLICVVQIPMVIVNLMNNCVFLICDIVGILGLLLFNYTLHLQCLVLFGNVRFVTRAFRDKKQAFTWKWLCFGIFASLMFDAAISVFPTIMYGNAAYIPSVGYCYYIYQDHIIVGNVLRMIYSIHLLSVVLLCFVFYFILVRYIKRHSARPDLARQRHVLVFKVMFKKFLLWVFSYSIILITRYVDRTGSWSIMFYQLGYFLVWSNSVIRPLVEIFGKLSRDNILPCHAK